MKQLLLYALFAVLFLTAGSRLEIARREMNQPNLSPVAANLYLDGTAVGMVEVELPVQAVSPLVATAEAQEVKGKKAVR